MWQDLSKVSRSTIKISSMTLFPTSSSRGYTCKKKILNVLSYYHSNRNITSLERTFKFRAQGYHSFPLRSPTCQETWDLVFPLWCIRWKTQYTASLGIDFLNCKMRWVRAERCLMNLKFCEVTIWYKQTFILAHLLFLPEKQRTLEYIHKELLQCCRFVVPGIGYRFLHMLTDCCTSPKTALNWQNKTTRK